ncbi:MAG: SMC-Scp complex subunit ScpB [Myxococcales bacterium]|nr:SMC-Scp complex subunit ScpB [Myxococcales bacterium]
MADTNLKHVIESLIFVADKPVTTTQLSKVAKASAKEINEALGELVGDYKGRGLELVEVSGGYQFRSSAHTSEYVKQFVAQRPVRLTRAQLEVLAIIAYRQPLTRPEIEEIRGVDSGSALRVVLERALIKILGRKEEPGRPLMYGTTGFFLEFFGLPALKDLPTLREFSELSEESRALFERKSGESFDDVRDALERQAESAQLDTSGEEPPLSDAD